MTRRHDLTRYEVQFPDGLGNWRRWSLCKTRAGAERSLGRLRALLGVPYLGRIVEVRR